ncbi:hypothetical protein [Alteribacillus bidgolensis]|uniref:Uncharacterized protein n=1 Tax=Alteribacillus bidgolensis TaxID=930129 RepID=A0A1G8HDD4_9BACI|nr:hypothetical protein [Alteribacillus bidgolensis]SDI04684.1 hypothetical protein SAMN05216352_104212 [Alteribacillus bidgolensis]
MNNFRWLAPFMGRRRRFTGWNRRNNRGGMGMGMLLTLLGIGAGAAWAGIAQNNNNGRQPVRNMLSNAQRAMPNTETAFSEELTPDDSNFRNQAD